LDSTDVERRRTPTSTRYFVYLLWSSSRLSINSNHTRLLHECQRSQVTFSLAVASAGATLRSAFPLIVVGTSSGFFSSFGRVAFTGNGSSALASVAAVFTLRFQHVLFELVGHRVAHVSRGVKFTLEIASKTPAHACFDNTCPAHVVGVLGQVAGAGLLGDLLLVLGQLRNLLALLPLLRKLFQQLLSLDELEDHDLDLILLQVDGGGGEFSHELLQLQLLLLEFPSTKSLHQLGVLRGLFRQLECLLAHETSQTLAN